MDTLPLVTVATVSYNSSRYIRDTIQSVLSQSHANIEYIIADDCSSDDSWNLIGEFNDPRIRKFRNASNIGEYRNRNQCIDLASGKYFIFIDGDDVIFPHGLSFFVSMMEKFPAAGMAIQKNYFNNILYPLLLEPAESLRNHFFGQNNLLNSSFTSVFFKTEYLKKYKLCEDCVTGDEKIRLQLASVYPVLFVAGWVSWPRETPGQASSKLDLSTSWSEKYRFSNEILDELSRSQFDRALIEDMRNSVRKRVARICVHLLKRGNVKEYNKLRKQTRLGWNDILRYHNYVEKFTDPLVDYSAASPIKRDFLKDGSPHMLPTA